MYVLVVCYNVSDLFGEIRTQLQETRTRSRFMLIVDPIHRRFEDLSIGWSVDQYRFVQWRPDGNSVPKPRHFMWVFVLMSFSSLPLLCFIRIISCDFILCFTSLTYCITSWGISDCSSYFCNWYKLVSVLFHVLVVHRCWLRPSIDIRRPDLTL